MARGPGPDWNRNTSPNQQSVYDLGEVAARLQRGFGSAHRGGRVIFSTYFADGMAEMIERIRSGTGANVSLDTVVSEFGKQSLKLTTGNLIGNTTIIGRWLTGTLETKLGFEVTIYNNLITNLVYRWYLTVSVFPGGITRRNYSVRLDYDGNAKNIAVRYFSAPATYTAVETIDQQLIGVGFNSIKLVMNLTTNKYDKLIIAGHTVDMSSLNVYSDTDTTKRLPGALLELGFENRSSGASRVCSVGSFIVTLDEP